MAKNEKNKKIVFGIAIVIFLLSIFTALKLQKHNFCANSISCIQDLSGIYGETDSRGEFWGKIVNAPKERPIYLSYNQVLGITTEEKRIEINLSTQRLYAYEGNRMVYEFPISTGKWYHTPTGVYYTWIKLRYTRMTGGNKALRTYYNLPNVPYTMYFYNESTPKAQGYGIHGAYWHNNFGHPMSHGCVNMRIEDAEKLFYWADPPTKAHTTYADKDSPGTKIAIYGETPKE